MIAAWKAITSPVGMIVIALLLFAGILGYVYKEGQDSGASDVIEKQNRVDREIIIKGRDARDNVDRCHTAGGMWSRTEGKCFERM